LVKAVANRVKDRIIKVDVEVNAFLREFTTVILTRIETQISFHVNPLNPVSNPGYPTHFNWWSGIRVEIQPGLEPPCKHGLRCLGLKCSTDLNRSPEPEET
jgi:hypothetical protein